MRDLLRALPVFVGQLAEFDLGAVPEEPTELFARWLRDAVDAGVAEPHALTLSTCDADGMPDARVLILKDVDEHGWWFATSARSAKGVQLAARPAAAMTFYWSQLGRQVRVRGTVVLGTPRRNADDFRARGVGARAVALASHESQPLASRVTCVNAVTAARERLDREPDQVSPSWQVYGLAPATVEFWQADKDRLHARVQYRREDGWTHQLLWP